MASRLHPAPWAGRLNSGVSRQVKQGQKRCVERLGRLSFGNLRQLRSVNSGSRNKRAHWSLLSVEFLLSVQRQVLVQLFFTLRIGFWRSTTHLRLCNCGGMLSINGGRLQVPGSRPSNNSFKPNLLRSSKKHGKKSLPCFCFHYAVRLNSGVSRQWRIRCNPIEKGSED